MKCYFSLTCIDKSPEYLNLFEVALKTLRQNTTLNPVVIYDGNVDGETYSIIKKYDASVVMREFSKKHALVKLYSPEYLTEKFGHIVSPEKLFGAFMRFEIPFVECEDDYVLYADIDCMFMSDVKLSDFSSLPHYIAAAPEFDRNCWEYFNSGVLLINVPNFREKAGEVFDMIERGVDTIGAFDQGYLNEVHQGLYDKLPLELNWKPYWGRNESAKIIHFHGMKPTGTVAASGFNMADSAFVNIFEQECGCAGYIYYTNLFVSVLGKNCEKWLAEHYAYLLNLMVTHANNIKNIHKIKDRKRKVRAMFIYGIVAFLFVVGAICFWR